MSRISSSRPGGYEYSHAILLRGVFPNGMVEVPHKQYSVEKRLKS